MNDAARMLDQLFRKPKGILSKKKPVSEEAVAKTIKTISSNLFDGVMVVLDPKQHKIVKINDPYCILSGGYGDSVLDRDFSELVPLSKKDLIKELFQKLFGSRVKRPVVEVTIPIGINETVAENIRARVYCQDSQICLLVDREELSRMQEIEVIRLKALISGSPDSGFWVTDTDGIIKDVVGPNCSVHLGYDEKELVGMNIGTFNGKDEPLTVDAGGNPDKARIIYRRSKSGELVKTDVVQKRITMSNGDEYILHLDTYPSGIPLR